MSKIGAWLRTEWSWEAGRDYFLIALGALLQALALRLFLVPARLASGGISGLAQIVNFYTHWPIGVMVILGNIPLFVLGWRYLGGTRFALRTAFAVLGFSLFTDVLYYYLPAAGLTSDLLLNTLYGGVISGIGYGLVYRARHQRRQRHPGAHPQPLARHFDLDELSAGRFAGHPGCRAFL